MKTIFMPGLAVLAILVAVSMAKAEDAPIETSSATPAVTAPAVTAPAVPLPRPRPAAAATETEAPKPRTAYDVMLESKVNPYALKKAWDYLQANKSKFPNQTYLTLIDYSKPSTEERMYVFEIKTGKATKYLVAHGMGSGGLKANNFSNGGGSGASSLGFFKTAEVYVGKHGRSLRLDGLSASNSRARARAVVIHAAGYLPMVVRGKRVKIAYVSPEMIKVQGRLGRSLGCPALDPRVAQKVINQVKDGSLLYAFSTTAPEPAAKKSAVKKTVAKPATKKTAAKPAAPRYPNDPATVY